MRAVVGIVVGLIASLAAAVIVGIVAFGTTLSLPAGTNAGDTRQVVAILVAMPQSTQLALAGAWLISGLAGAFVAKAIARRAWAGWAVALVVAAYFGLNAIFLPLLLWAKFLWIVAPLVGGLIGNRLARGGPAPEVVTVDDGDDIVLS